MKFIKSILEYLYYKYYFFQVSIGNQDVAKYTSIVIIAFILNFYFVTSLMIIGLLFNIKFSKIPKIGYIIVFLIVLLLLYMVLVYNDKYKKIINNENIKKKNNLLAIIFPLIGFIVVVLSLFVKMLQNQGRF